MNKWKSEKLVEITEATLPNMKSLSVSQLAAKFLQLHLKGKLEEAQKLT
ncbi:unnamed protein product, partial [Brassica rapa subsp. narinosa]